MDKGGSIKAVCVSAPKSGSGKTMFVCGLIRTLRDRGMRVKCFKTGPDHIDPLFHDRINDDTEFLTENLDGFFSGPEDLKNIFNDGSRGADISLIEGVMGLYDGITVSGDIDVKDEKSNKHVCCSERGNEEVPKNAVVGRASTYETAACLKVPVILLVDAKGASTSLIAGIRGFIDYDREGIICGVVLNRCSKSLYDSIGSLMESELGIRVFGYIPVLEDIKIESRYPGLMLPEEVVDIKQKIDKFAEIIKECVDIDGIIESSCRP